MANDALLRVIRIVGSGKKLAAELGISKQRLNAWLNNGVEIPAEYAGICQLLAGGCVTWEQLTPRKAAAVPKKWRARLFASSIAPAPDSTRLTAVANCIKSANK